MFITFEGNDGSGKTTIINGLKDIYRKCGKKVFTTREPGGKNCWVAEKIRKIIMDNDLTPEMELLLFMVSRLEHIEKVLNKKSKTNDLILCDRYYYSSVVYQGCLRELGMKKVLDMNKIAFKNNIPDLTIIVLVKPECGLKRIKENNMKQNRFDKMNIEKHNKIYNGYKKILKYDKNIYTIDTTNYNAKQSIKLAKEIIDFKLNENRTNISK